MFLFCTTTEYYTLKFICDIFIVWFNFYCILLTLKAYKNYGHKQAL